MECNWLALDAVSLNKLSTNHNHLIKKFNSTNLVAHASCVSSTFNRDRFLILAFAAVLIGDGLSWHIVLLPIVGTTRDELGA